MAKSTSSSSGWLKGRVKAVLSGDTMVVMGIAKGAEIPPEKNIALAYLVAPRLARKEGNDEQFAWKSKEFLRNLCIGKVVVFKTEYTIPNYSRECCSVFIDSTNIAKEVVKNGWAKVKEAREQGTTPEHTELLRLEEQAREQGKGLWNKSPGATADAIRNLPPSADFDANGFLAANKGRSMKAIVEHVRDGSCLYAYLLPEFQFVQVLVAGIQAPSMRRRVINESTKSSALTNTEVNPEPFGREAKHYTEIRVLSRDVRIVLEGVDKNSNLIGSVYYPDGEKAKDLALELIENGFAKYVEWSANMMELEARWKLKAAELEAKKNKLRMWANYVPPATDSKAISNNFTGKVIEVVSGDCIIVADDSVPYGSPASERRVNLSSTRCPKMGNPIMDVKPDPYAREAKELLRTRLIGRHVQVSMEYSGRVPTANGSTDTRVMGFGSVFLLSQGKDSENVSSSGGQQTGVNVAELIISRGFGTVVGHRDFEERSHYYEKLLAAQSRAEANKKGIHSSKDSPVMHVKDLTKESAKKAKEYLPSLQRSRRTAAIVEYVLSGHRFKLHVPKEACSITFSLSGVRCPGREEAYSDEAISLMRRKLMQRDVEIEVETVDKNGTFLGSLWESNTNAGVTLLEAGLAMLQTFFRTNNMTDAHLLAQAEQLARKQKLKIWGKQVEETSEQILDKNVNPDLPAGEKILDKRANPSAKETNLILMEESFPQLSLEQLQRKSNVESQSENGDDINSDANDDYLLDAGKH
uniref:ribonuclease TUDOR 1-like n=1 Tax=Erigeron canadensis TaxID=72917 RepID=UPI001CB8BA7B|nr:ribonuclease TUDOR 1-like [Erigeron canadensis]